MRMMKNAQVVTVNFDFWAAVHECKGKIGKLKEYCLESRVLVFDPALKIMCLDLEISQLNAVCLPQFKPVHKLTICLLGLVSFHFTSPCSLILRVSFKTSHFFTLLWFHTPFCYALSTYNFFFDGCESFYSVRIALSLWVLYNIHNFNLDSVRGDFGQFEEMFPRKWRLRAWLDYSQENYSSKTLHHSGYIKNTWIQWRHFMYRLRW